MTSAAQFDKSFKAFMRRVLSQESEDGFYKLFYGRNHYKVEHSEPLQIAPLIQDTDRDGNAIQKLPSFTPKEEAQLKAIYVNLKTESEVKKALKQQPNIVFAAQVKTKKMRIQSHQRGILIESAKLGVTQANTLCLDNPIATQLLGGVAVYSTLTAQTSDIEKVALEEFPHVPIASSKRAKKFKRVKVDVEEEEEEEEKEVLTLNHITDSLETNEISETGGMRLK